MSNKQLQSFICQICGKTISLSQQSSHKLNCQKISNNINKRLSSKITVKNVSKTKEHINTIPLNYQAFAIDINNQVNCFNLDLIKESSSINCTSEEKLSDDGIKNVTNLNANYIINPNSPDDINIFNINTATIIESFIINYNPVDQAILDNLPVNIINDLKAFLDSKCVVCLQEYELGDKYIRLPCFHNYHEDCIKRWLRINNKCPTCNYVLSANNIR